MATPTGTASVLLPPDSGAIAVVAKSSALAADRADDVPPADTSSQPHPIGDRYLRPPCVPSYERVEHGQRRRRATWRTRH
jgi:hypothetical protein